MFGYQYVCISIGISIIVTENVCVIFISIVLVGFFCACMCEALRTITMLWICAIYKYSLIMIMIRNIWGPAKFQCRHRRLIIFIKINISGLKKNVSAFLKVVNVSCLGRMVKRRKKC